MKNSKMNLLQHKTAKNCDLHHVNYEKSEEKIRNKVIESKSEKY